MTLSTCEKFSRKKVRYLNNVTLREGRRKGCRLSVKIMLSITNIICERPLIVAPQIKAHVCVCVCVCVLFTCT